MGRIGHMIMAALVGLSALALAVGCGGDDGAATETTTSAVLPAPAPGPQGRAFREAKWIEESRIAEVLAEFRRDIRSFTEKGRPSGLAFGDEKGWRYFCGKKLGQGGPPPTQRLVELRRLAREACDHLQRALEASTTFRAGTPSGGDTAGAAMAARQAREPAARAQALLDAARG